MKTIYCEKEIKLFVNGVEYTFGKNQFVQKIEIVSMKHGKDFCYDEGGRYSIITPLTENDAKWFNKIAELNNVYDYTIIDIIK